MNSAAPASDSPSPFSSARLVALTGPLTGELLSLVDRPVSIGREASNDICLADVAVSRSHCTIALQHGAWHVRDNGSVNGTFVNGTAIVDRPLQNRDRIQLGQSMFLFLDDSHGLSVSAATERPTQLVTRLPVEDNGCAEPSAGREAPRAERDLRTLLTIAARVNGLNTEQDLYTQLLDQVSEAISVDQLAVVALESDGATRVVHARAAAGCTPLPVSETVVRHSIEQRTSLFARDVAHAAALESAASVAAAGWQSILCVPMVVRGRVVGAVYAATCRAGAYGEDDLRLLTAIAGIGAVALDNLRQLAWLTTQMQQLRTELEQDQILLGRSGAMQRVYQVIAKVARSDASALIAGETGTGKELAARAVHLNSDRAKRPFVAINCAALSETLLESELFGHERGAFTGAVAQKKGRLEVADGGTVFLDEIGELALTLQSKLLRAVQQREFERLGGTRPIRVDVRFICATNRNLADEVAAGRFPADLFHRLNVVQIDMPPLRDRREDIPALAAHFVARFSRGGRRLVRGISPEAMRCLAGYDWPGNVRELENAIERAVVLGSCDHVLLEDLPEALLERAAPRASDLPRFHDSVRLAKIRAILDAFREAHGSYVETARLLGLHPNYLHRLIRNLALKPSLEQER